MMDFGRAPVVCVLVAAMAGAVFGQGDANEEEHLATIRAFRRLDLTDTELVVATATRLLDENPGYHQLRLRRAQHLGIIGKLQAAHADVDYVLAATGPSYEAWSVKISLFRTAGDTERERAAFREWLALAPRMETNPLVTARIAELDGDLASAERILAAAPDEGSSGLVSSSLGDLLVRSGRYEDAATAYKRAFGASEAHPSVQASAAARMMHSQWAAGDRAGAWETAMKMAGGAREGNTRLPPPTHHDPKVIAALAAIVLAAGDGRAERLTAAAEAADATLSERIPGRGPLVAILAAVRAQGEVEPLATMLADTLKEAPQLDWALWGAMYLGLTRPQEAGHLLKLLPDGSIQKVIVQGELGARGAAAQPGP